MMDKCIKKFKPTPIALAEREVWGLSIRNLKESLIGHRLAHSQSLFKRDLLGHYGCVNAIEFSNDGELIASGGDDRRLLMWNVTRTIYDGKAPQVIDTQHISNINSCCFDLTNKKIATGGNDGQVIIHDFSCQQSTSVYGLSDAIYCLSPDPINTYNIATAGDDGKAQIIDTRLPANSSPLVLADWESAMHSVTYNPIDPRLLATANATNGVALWDIRRPKKSLTYKSCSNCMSVRFNCFGDKLLALRRRSSPVLFDIGKSQPIYEFDYTTYYNACTLKSCCFAGLKDEYIVSGSDDFCIYLWKIPTDIGEPYHQKEPHMILKGHRSIVNQVRYCPINQMLISSGVEKLIKMWTPYNIPGSTGKLVHSRRYGDDEELERNAYTHEEYIHMVLQAGSFLSHDYTNGNTEEEPCMIAFFDSLIQREVEQSEEEQLKDDTSNSGDDNNIDSGDQNDSGGGGGILNKTNQLSTVPVSANYQDVEASRETTSGPLSRVEESSRPFFPHMDSSSSSDDSDSEVDEILRAMYSRYMNSRDQALSSDLQPSGKKISSLIAKGKQHDLSKRNQSRKLQRIREDLQHSGDHFLRDNATNMSILADIIDNFVDNLVTNEPSSSRTLSDTNDGHMSTDSASHNGFRDLSDSPIGVSETSHRVFKEVQSSPNGESSIDTSVISNMMRPGPSSSDTALDSASTSIGSDKTCSHSLQRGIYQLKSAAVHFKSSKPQCQNKHSCDPTNCDHNKLSLESDASSKPSSKMSDSNKTDSFGPTSTIVSETLDYTGNAITKNCDSDTSHGTLSEFCFKGGASKGILRKSTVKDVISLKKLNTEILCPKSKSNTDPSTLGNSTSSALSQSSSARDSAVHFTSLSSHLKRSSDVCSLSDNRVNQFESCQLSRVSLPDVIDCSQEQTTTQTVHFKKASRKKNRHFRVSHINSQSSSDEEEQR